MWRTSPEVIERILFSLGKAAPPMPEVVLKTPVVQKVRTAQGLSTATLQIKCLLPF